MITTTRSRHILLLSAGALVVTVVVAVLVLTTRPTLANAAKTWAWGLDYRVFRQNTAELAEMHKNASRYPREQCAGCHSDQKSSNLILHRIHLQSPLLPGLQCHQCHQSVDLTRRGNHAVVTWVDVGFCKKCHSEFPGLTVGSKMRPAYFERNCTTCHSGKNAPKHAQSYLAKNISASECKGCHGGRVLPWTPLHERANWMQSHGPEALRLGADSCYRCHDFGLKFCANCHNKKPPSHSPAERWRTIHPEAARADTRRCYSCHPTSFCKKCHLNHEAGWIARHAVFVHEKGTGSCRECHSASSCSFCHTASSEGSTDATLAP